MSFAINKVFRRLAWIKRIEPRYKRNRRLCDQKIFVRLVVKVCTKNQTSDGEVHHNEMSNHKQIDCEQKSKTPEFRKKISCKR